MIISDTEYREIKQATLALPNGPEREVREKLVDYLDEQLQSFKEERAEFATLEADLNEEQIKSHNLQSQLNLNESELEGAYVEIRRLEKQLEEQRERGEFLSARCDELETEVVNLSR